MSNTKTSYRTGETCERTGNYISESGRRNEFREGEKFLYCPVTGTDTTWELVE